MLHPQLAWYVAGPILGLCVVAVRWLFGARLGVTGGFSEIVEKVGARSLRFDWRGWFAIGVLLGGTLFALIAGGPDFHGYGYLTRTFHGSAQAWIAPILVTRRRARRLRRQALGRLHVGQRAERHVVAEPGEPRRHRDVLLRGDRRQLPDQGGDVMSRLAAGAAIGVVFGVVLSWSGMSSPDVIRGALLLEQSYLFLFFASAVLVATAGTELLRRRARASPSTGRGPSASTTSARRSSASAGRSPTPAPARSQRSSARRSAGPCSRWPGSSSASGCMRGCGSPRPSRRATARCPPAGLRCLSPES